jgi:hypothetical protein
MIKKDGKIIFTEEDFKASKNLKNDSEVKEYCRLQLYKIARDQALKDENERLKHKK